MTKTREKLVEIGLVVDKNKNIRFSPASFVLTEEGEKLLKKLEQ